MTIVPGEEVAQRIAASGASIYDEFDRSSENYYENQLLEDRLTTKLIGQQWPGAIRTRSKLSKEAVADALGYPVPKSFKKVQPRFTAQNLDVYVQQNENLQIWNEDVDPERRYVLVRTDQTSTVIAVRVVTGEAVALWDKTGTLTSKFQAARHEEESGSKLVSAADTPQFRNLLIPDPTRVSVQGLRPEAPPEPGKVLPIQDVHERLLTLVGRTFRDPGITNERGRGEILQKLVTEVLEIGEYGDKGQFPDILNQGLEVKLQLARTIDLGIVSPDSQLPAEDVSTELRHCDMRYAIFFGSRNADEVTLEAVVTSTGEDFFQEFRKFQGKVSNKKRQLKLPSGLFEPKG